MLYGGKNELVLQLRLLDRRRQTNWWQKSVIVLKKITESRLVQADDLNAETMRRV